MKRAKCKKWKSKSRVALAAAVLLMAIDVMAAALLFPSKAYASASGNGWEWDSDTKTLTITSDAGVDAAKTYDTRVVNVVLGEGLTALPANMFSQCGILKNVSMTGSVKSIGNNAFEYCYALEEITLPEGVESIGDKVFMGCSSLTKAVLPSTLNAMGKEVFHSCDALKEVTIPEGVEVIGEKAFDQLEGLETIKIPSTVKNVGDRAFYSCPNLKTVEIADGAVLGTYMFSGCKNLANVTLPSDLETIPNRAFSYCILSSITIPASVKTIGMDAFMGCPFEQITIPDGVEEIGEYAFASTGLKSVIIPASAKTIGAYAFESCSNLEQVTLLSKEVPTIGNGSISAWMSLFGGAKFETEWDGKPGPYPQSIFVPGDVLEDYKEAWPHWSLWMGAAVISSETEIDPTAEDYEDVAIDVQAHTENSTTYSVDVEWGAMTFRYENSTWDATAHKTVTGAGWRVYDSEAGKTLKTTTEQVNRIQVTNHSNAEIWTTLAYAGASGYEDTTGSFEKKADDTATEFDTAKNSLHLKTADNAKAEGVAGVATVGTVYFMPSGIKEGLKTDGIAKWTQLGTITVGIKTQAP